MSASADFELGTTGATIATTDTGSATAWDAVALATGGAATYDATHVYGTKAAKLVGGTAGSTTLTWDAGFPDQSGTHYGRIYLYMTANPAATFVLLQGLNSASLAYRLRITTAGKIDLADANGTVQGTTTNSIALNQFVRIEYKIIHGNPTGSIEVKLFNSPDSTTATETKTVTSINTLTASTKVSYFVGNNVTLWLDNVLAAVTAGYPGPVSVATHVGPFTGRLAMNADILVEWGIGGRQQVGSGLAPSLAPSIGGR